MNIEAAKNHLRMWMDYHGQKGTLDSAVVAQAMAAIVQAETTERLAVAMERQAAAMEKLAACVYMDYADNRYLKVNEF